MTRRETRHKTYRKVENANLFFLILYFMLEYSQLTML